MARRARKNQEVTLGRRQRRRKEQRRKNVKEVIGTILYLVILCTIFYTSLCRTEDSCTRRFYGYDSL